MEHRASIESTQFHSEAPAPAKKKESTLQESGIEKLAREPITATKWALFSIGPLWPLINWHWHHHQSKWPLLARIAH